MGRSILPCGAGYKKGDWFDYYAQYFTTVEINSTFYWPPGEFQVNAWIQKGKDKKGFEYSLKVPQFVTHKALVEGDKERAIFWATSFEKTCVRPLADAGLLGGVLLQLSPYFKNEDTALDALNGMLDAVSHQDFDYAVDSRLRLENHTSFVRGLQLCDVSDAFSVSFPERDYYTSPRSFVDLAGGDKSSRRETRG